MKQEDKDLLLHDLCARLPYGVKATTTANGWNGIYTITGYANDRIYLDCPVYDKGDDEWLVESVKPYLRPLSSTTEEERDEYTETFDITSPEVDDYDIFQVRMVDWLHKHHFDVRGLIEKGLALEAPEGMYNT